jgi:2-amino-4-hydroxy-6-hydroxymethyldihydropteridine diphosphokinase
MATCLVGLGSNVGDRTANLAAAVARLEDHRHVRVAAVSRWLASAAVGGPAGQGEFLNGAAVVETNLGPRQFLELLLDMEKALGRAPGPRWGPRSIDLDLLLYDELAIDEPGLRVPHPRMAVRRFVLEPAASIAPELVHPELQWTVADMLAHLVEARPYVAIAGGQAALRGALAERVAELCAGRLLASSGFPPADPPGRARSAGPAEAAWLQFVRAQRDLVDVERLPAAPRRVVSDFWFDEIPAWAAARLPATAARAIRSAWLAERDRAATAKLIVLLEVTEPGDAGDAHRRELAAQVETYGRVPRLYLAATDLVPAVEEVSAAMASME